MSEGVADVGWSTMLAASFVAAREAACVSLGTVRILSKLSQGVGLCKVELGELVTAQKRNGMVRTRRR
jgi:hypothetical protein